MGKYAISSSNQIILFVLFCFIFISTSLAVSTTEIVDEYILNLNEGDASDRLYAAIGLGEIGDPRAIDPLIDALNDEEKCVRLNAAIALSKIGEPRAVDNIPADYIIIVLNGSSHCGFEDDFDDAMLRREAAQILGLFDDAQVINALVKALKDDHGVVRGEAAQSLGKIGNSSAVDPLIDALKDNFSDVRMFSAEALGEIGDPRAIDPLIETLKEEKNYISSDINVELYAIRALGKIGDPRAIGALEYVESNHRDDIVRWEATESLRKIGSGS